jgi:chromosome segregation ATPase
MIVGREARARQEAERVDRLRSARVALGREVAALRKERAALLAATQTVEDLEARAAAAVARAQQEAARARAEVEQARAEFEALEQRRREKMTDLAQTFALLASAREQLVTAEHALANTRSMVVTERARLDRTRAAVSAARTRVPRSAYEERFG